MRLATLLFALTALGMSLSSARAQTDVDAPDRTGDGLIHYAILASDVAPILERAGFTLTPRQVGSDIVLEARDEGGFAMLAVLILCDQPGEPEGCLGTSFATRWTLSDSGQRAAIRAIAERGVFSTVREEGSELILQRYVMADGGITLDNLEQNLFEFLIDVVGVTESAGQELGLELARPR